MDINNLKVGEEFKNYKALCECINVAVKKGGRNVQQQKQKLKRYFDWITEGRKIIITEIYSDPKPDNRKGNCGKSEGSRGNNNIYGKYIDNILIDYFIEHLKKYEGLNISLTNIKIAELSGLINLNYSIVNKDKDKFYKYLLDSTTSVTKTVIKDVFRTIQGIFKPTILSSLSRLEKQGYIEFYIGYLLIEKIEDKDDIKEVDRYADDEESKVIKKIEDKVLKEMGITIFKINNNDKIKKEYYNKVTKRVKEVFKSEFDTRIKSYWTSYEIDISKTEQAMDFTNEQLDEIEELKIISTTVHRKLKEFKVDRDKLKQELNKLLIKNVKSKIHNNKISIEHKIKPTLGRPNSMQPQWIKDIIDCKYVECADSIIKYLIQLDSKSIKDELEKIKEPKKLKQQNQDDYSWLYGLD